MLVLLIYLIAGMFDKDKPIVDQSCQPAYPGVNLTIGVAGDIIPTSEWPKQYSPEEWEANIVMSGGYRNKATQPAVDRLGLHTIRAWNTSLALWGVSSKFQCTLPAQANVKS